MTTPDPEIFEPMLVQPMSQEEIMDMAQGLQEALGDTLEECLKEVTAWNQAYQGTYI